MLWVAADPAQGGQKSMKTTIWRTSAFALAAAGLALGSPAEARHRHYHHRSHEQGHSHCLRFNKTTGTLVGVAGGAVLGHAIFGGTGGTVVGAAAGGVAGHSLAHNGRKRCR
jgi:osmotically inducible lipoprotein OsmB